MRVFFDDFLTGRAGASAAFWLLACVLVLAAQGRAQEAGAASSFRWAGWEVPAGAMDERSALSIVEDGEAESQRPVKGEDGKEVATASALQARVSRRAIAQGPVKVALTPVIPWTGIEAGVYRVRARVKYDGDENVIGTPLELWVATPDAPKQPGAQGTAAAEFYSFDLGETGTWTEVSFLYEVDPTFSRRTGAAMPRSSWRYGQFLKDAYPEYVAPVVEVKPTAPKGLQLGITLPKTKLEVDRGLPPNSLRSVSVDWLALEKVEPSVSLTVRGVRAGKRWLRPGEGQQFMVDVANYGSAAVTRELTLALERGVGAGGAAGDGAAERVVVETRSVTLEPGARSTYTVDWATTPETPIWGYEVRAEVRQGDVVESMARDAFSVSERVYDVHVMGGNTRWRDPYLETTNYQNLMEIFGATPGDMAQVMPETEQWLCGMSTISQSFPIVRATTDHNRAMGVATHMYLFAGGTNMAVMDLYVKKPEWLASRLNATDEVYTKSAATSALVLAHDYAKDGALSVPSTPHIEEHLNQWYPELLERIIGQTQAFVERTGYDGIRFDVGLFGPRTLTTVFGEKLPHTREEIQPRAAANWRTFDAAMKGKFPHFEYGANMDTYQYLDHVGLRDVEAPAPEEYPEFIAFCQSHGMLMDEGTMNAPLFNSSINRFEDGLWSMVQKRTVTRKFGGVYQLFSPHRDGRGYFAHDDIYWTIMAIASGSCYVGHFTAAPYCEDSPGFFITRYSEYFRSLDLVPIPDAEEAIYVDAAEPLWYADTAVQAQVGDRLRYVVPLINPPVNDRMRRNKANELPPPVEDEFAIEVQVPEGYTTATAWMLTWEPRSEMVPLEVIMKDEGRTAIVDFPGLQLFRTLVMEFAK